MVEDIIFETYDSHKDYIQILSHKLTMGMSVKDYAENTGKWLEKNLKNYKEKEEKIYKNNSLSGIVRAYTYIKENKLRFVTEYYFIQKNKSKNRGYTLIFDRLEELSKKYLEEFEQIKEYMLNSFTIYP